MAAKKNAARKRDPDLGPYRNRIVGEGFANPEDLTANPDNWRIHPSPQQTALTEALSRLGWIQRVIVNKRTGHVIDGHLRCSLAMRDGAKVPVIYVDMSEAEEKIALATIDPLSAMAATDAEKLSDLIEDLDLPEGSALSEMLSDLLPNEPEKTKGAGEGARDDRGPAAGPGDVWQMGPHTLRCTKDAGANFAAVDAVLRQFFELTGIDPVRKSDDSPFSELSHGR